MFAHYPAEDEHGALFRTSRMRCIAEFSMQGVRVGLGLPASELIALSKGFEVNVNGLSG